MNLGSPFGDRRAKQTSDPTQSGYASIIVSVSFPHHFCTVSMATPEASNGLGGGREFQVSVKRVESGRGRKRGGIDSSRPRCLGCACVCVLKNELDTSSDEARYRRRGCWQLRQAYGGRSGEAGTVTQRRGLRRTGRLLTRSRAAAACSASRMSSSSSWRGGDQLLAAGEDASGLGSKSRSREGGSKPGSEGIGSMYVFSGGVFFSIGCGRGEGAPYHTHKAALPRFGKVQGRRNVHAPVSAPPASRSLFCDHCCSAQRPCCPAARAPSCLALHWPCCSCPGPAVPCAAAWPLRVTRTSWLAMPVAWPNPAPACCMRVCFRSLSLFSLSRARVHQASPSAKGAPLAALRRAATVKRYSAHDCPLGRSALAPVSALRGDLILLRVCPS